MPYLLAILCALTFSVANASLPSSEVEVISPDLIGPELLQPMAVYYEFSEEGELTPYCKIDLTQSPELTPDFSDVDTHSEIDFDLPPCRQDQLAMLKTEAQSFRLNKELALIQIPAAMTYMTYLAGSCVISAISGGMAGYFFAEENKKAAKVSATVNTVSTLTATAGVYTSVKKTPTPVWAGSAARSLLLANLTCTTAGGAIGYLIGDNW